MISDDDPVIIGIANPRGLPDEQKSYFYRKEDIERARDRIKKAVKPMPLYIDHIREMPSDGKTKIAPAGEVLDAAVGPQGKLMVSALVLPTSTGNVLKQCMSEPGTRFRQLSIGYRVFEDHSQGSVPIPEFKDEDEVSVCLQGDRPGTDIVKCVSWKDYTSGKAIEEMAEYDWSKFRVVKQDPPPASSIDINKSINSNSTTNDANPEPSPPSYRFSKFLQDPLPVRDLKNVGW